MPSADDFRDALFEAMADALRAGQDYLELDAGELHRHLGWLSRSHHRMPSALLRSRNQSHGSTPLISGPLPQLIGAGLSTRLAKGAIQ